MLKVLKMFFEILNKKV